MGFSETAAAMTEGTSKGLENQVLQKLCENGRLKICHCSYEGLEAGESERRKELRWIDTGKEQKKNLLGLWRSAGVWIRICATKDVDLCFAAIKYEVF